MNKCHICQKQTDDLYECDECEHLVCADHIVDRSRSIDNIIVFCVDCIEKLRF